MSIIALLIATYAGTSNWQEFGMWAFIILFFTVLVPFAYVYIKSRSQGNKNKKIPEMLSFVKEQRKEIWILVIIAGIPFIASLIILKAPIILIATLVSLIGSCLIVALVNRFYKASFHISSVTIMVIIAIVVWGLNALPALIVLPLVGWSRFSVKEHSLIQLAVGFIIALIVGGASLYGFGVSTWV